MQDVAFIFYSHSDCYDIWDAFFGQTEELLPKSFRRKYAFVNKEAITDLIPSDFEIVFYDDKKTYSERMSDCLAHVGEEFCIFQHEDMILYRKPDEEKLDEYLQILKSENDLDFIKLLKGGDLDDEPYGEYEELFKVKEWLFAVQPTLWKMKSLQKIMFGYSKSIWDLERDIQEHCREIGIVGAYAYRGEQQRGRHHFDSDTYPFIATAICKGKWNIAEYGCELEEVFREYEIDRNIRGCIG